MKKHIAFILVILAVIGAIIYGQYKEPKATPIASVFYVCDGNKTVSASYYAGKLIPSKPGEPPVPTGSVDLKLSDGRSLTLPQTISASGIRYANKDESFIFWSKGDGAFVVESSTTTFSGCVKK